MIANIETDPKHPKHPLGYGLAEARAAAIRFAEGRPTRRDHGNSSWDNDEPGPARPDWLAFVKGFPVVAEYRDNGRMAWHPKCRLPIYDLAKGRRPRRKAKVVAKPPRFVQVTERATCGHLLITTLPAARTPALARVGMSVSYCDIGRSDCGVITEARADGALVHGCEGDVVFLKWCDVSLTGVRPDPTYIVDRAEGTSSRPARARR